MSMNIALFPNFIKDSNGAVTIEVIRTLLGYNCKVMTEPENLEFINELHKGGIAGLQAADRETLLKNSDAGVVVGGDGTILRLAGEAAYTGLPLLGINLGRVGYIAELETSELNLLEQFTLGKYTIEKRFMLEAELTRNAKTVFRSGPTLNDIVIMNGPIPEVMTYDISYNESEPFTYRTNGLIFATPTGSTAYSMAAGGAVLESVMEGICLTPVCSHFLIDRPVVLSGDTVLKLSGAECRGSEVYLSADGCRTVRMKYGDTVTVQASAYKTKLIKLKKRGFLSVLRMKIHDT